MVLISAEARAQLEALERHYAEFGRDVASLHMAEAVAVAVARIEAQEGPFFPAPRPYPELVRYGWLWLKQARYWVAFTPIATGHAITAVFYDTANIPGRL